jgi:hypothetical protein
LSHAFLRDAALYPFLLAIDLDLAREAQEKRCGACNGALHVANYPRSPMGMVGGRGGGKAVRLSFCCAEEGCRKRQTPGSVRFLGRKFYFGVIVLLASVIYNRATASQRDRLEDRLGVSERTLVRWRRWWLQDFAQSRFWTAVRGRFATPVESDHLPASLLERFEGDERTQVVATLRFLVPIAGGKGLAVVAF